MAGILEAVKNAIATEGARRVSELSQRNPWLGGKVGRTIDIVGKFLGNPLPEKGASEMAESAGAVVFTPEQAVDKARARSGEATPPSPNPIERTYQIEKGYVPAFASSDGNAMPPMDELVRVYKSQGWTDENAIRTDIASGNWVNKVPQPPVGSGGGTNTVGELQKHIQSNPVSVKGMTTEDLNDVLKKMEERGMSAADALLERRREIAERYYRDTLAEAENRLGEVTSEAERRKRQAKEQEEFYKGELGKRKQFELEEIESQEQKALQSYESAKDEIAQNWRELSRKFEAQARAAGMSATSLIAGETRKLMNQFNSNLAKAWVAHKDTVDELNRAVRKTIETFDSKIGELEMNTRQMIEGVDAWLQEQINRIREMKDKALTYKMELVYDAMNQADNLKNQILDKIDTAKLNWSQWLAQIQTQYALSAKYAAEGNIASAKQSLDTSNKLLTLAEKQINLGAADVVSAPKERGGLGYYLVGRIPLTNEEYSIEIPNEEQAIALKKKLKSVLETNPLSQYLGGIFN